MLPEETLQQQGTAALMELLLKQVWLNDFLSSVRTLIEKGIWQAVMTETTETYLVSVLNYGVDQGDDNQSVDELMQLLELALPERKEVIMTFRQQLEQRSLQAGILQGVEKGKLETAREMLQVGSSVDFIKKVTGLSDLDLSLLESDNE